MPGTGCASSAEPPSSFTRAVDALIGRVPQQRTTAYGEVPADRRAASFNARDTVVIRYPVASTTSWFVRWTCRRLCAYSTSRAASPAGLGDVTHLIWPESAFPFFLTREPDALAQAGEQEPRRLEIGRAHV